MARTRVGRRPQTVAAVGILLVALPLGAQAPARDSRSPASADIQDIRYDVTFDRTTAASRTVKVAMSFSVASTGAVLLSLPEWTPGAYEISNFARFVVEFAAGFA